MEEIDKKIDKLLEILNQDQRIIDLKKYKQKLLNNPKFMKKMNKLHELDIYSDEYKTLKQELFQNHDFVEFKHLESEINLLIMEINQKLKLLTSERGCNHENH